MRSIALMYGCPPPPPKPFDPKDLLAAPKAAEDMGRGELLDLVASLTKERDAYLENLTATQARCTELLEEKRAIARSKMSALFPDATCVVLVRVGAERARQETLREAGKFPYTCASGGGLSEPEKLAVLAEEFGEVAREVTEGVNVKSTDAGDWSEEARRRLRDELEQVAAVCVGWCEALG